MSTKSYLVCRNQVFYYRLKVPTDLRHLIPAVEIKKSLKTKEIDKARSLAASMGYKVHAAFVQLRTGMLSEQQVKEIVSRLLSKKGHNDSATLSSVIDEYVERNERSWTQKTRLEIIASYKLILQIMGNLRLDVLTRQHMINLRNVLLQLPANLQKIYPNKKIDEVLKMPNIVPMSISSVNKHLSRISSLLRFSVLDGHSSVNYAEGLQLQQPIRSDEERKPYSSEDIRNILNALPKDSKRLDRYWIPVIGLYSGMRLDEICQLHLEDVEVLGHIACFNINDDGDKKLKNKASKRIIPVHPKLLELGFMKYVENIRRSEIDRLWPNLIRKRDGYSHDFGKWFQRFNRKHVTKDKAKVFHSFRHVVADTLKQAGVQEIVISEILGHANDSMTMSRYGKRYQPKVLLEALMHLDYGVQDK